MTKNDILIAENLLSSREHFAIVSHRNPDGDAIGSALGLGLFLQKMGNTVSVIIPNRYPNFLAWIPHIEHILIYEEQPELSQKHLNEAKAIFTVDFNAFHRTGQLMGDFLSQLHKPFLMIDHHEDPDDYPSYIFSDIRYGSTCEMIYHFITMLGKQDLIDQDIATCLYTGIVTDSGSFKYPTTTSTTHRVVAELIDKGINNSQIHNLLFDNSSYDRLKILGRALENMVVLPEIQTAYITLSEDELKSLNCKKGDTEGIVNYPLTLKDIVFSVIFIENKDEDIIKISFRSQGDFDVNTFARNYFNGGGHKNAAGGRSSMSLEQSVATLQKILENDNPTLY